MTRAESRTQNLDFTANKDTVFLVRQEMELTIC